MNKFFTILLVLAGGYSLYAAEWPHFRGVDYTGISEETISAKLDASSKPAWEAKVGTGYSSFAVSAGKAYTMGNKEDYDFVYCYDLKTGKLFWEEKYPQQIVANMYHGGPNATPTVDDKHVYVFSKSGHLFAFDKNKGGKKWMVDLKKSFGYSKPQWGFSSSPLVFENKVIVNAGSAGAAFDVNTGKTIWSSPNGAAGYASPIPYTFKGKKLISMFSGEHLYSLDPANGKILWQYAWPTNYKVNATQPVFNKDFSQVYISSGYGLGGVLLDISSGSPKEVWKNGELRNKMNSNVMVNNLLFGCDGQNQGSNKGALKCVDFTSGNTLWSKNQVGLGTVTAAGNVVVCLSEDGYLMLLKAENSYQEISRFKVLNEQCWTAPVVAEGYLLVRGALGTVKVYSIK